MKRVKAVLRGPPRLRSAFRPVRGADGIEQSPETAGLRNHITQNRTPTAADLERVPAERDPELVEAVQEVDLSLALRNVPIDADAPPPRDRPAAPAIGWSSRILLALLRERERTQPS